MPWGALARCQRRLIPGAGCQRRLIARCQRRPIPTEFIHYNALSFARNAREQWSVRTVINARLCPMMKTVYSGLCLAIITLGCGGAAYSSQSIGYSGDYSRTRTQETHRRSPRSTIGIVMLVGAPAEPARRRDGRNVRDEARWRKGGSARHPKHLRRTGFGQG